jgi:hypothetical protein
MATLTVPDHIKALAEKRAADAGFADVGEYIADLIQGNPIDGPEHLLVRSDDDVDRIVRERMNGPWVECTTEDFKRIRERYENEVLNVPKVAK